LKATINLEFYRLNYQLSNEINFSGLISVLDAAVGLLRMWAHAAASLQNGDRKAVGAKISATLVPSKCVSCEPIHMLG